MSLSGIRVSGVSGRLLRWVDGENSTNPSISFNLSTDIPRCPDTEMIHSLALSNGMTDTDTSSIGAAPGVRGAKLWVDGVGCWRIWLPEQFTIGGPASPASETRTGERGGADFALLADLSRRHAIVTRVGESFRIEGTGRETGGITLNGKQLVGGRYLAHGDEVLLGRDVRFRFRQPSELSPSATWVCESGHRPVERVDGVVFMNQTCLLGAGKEQHIVVPAAEATAVLFRREGKFWFRTAGEWSCNHTALSGPRMLSSGDVIRFGECQFRIELE